MFRRLLLAWVLLTPLAWPASGQTLVPGNVLPTRAALARLGLERAWYTSVPLGGGAERLIQISFADGLLFAQTDLAQLYAYDAETGRPLWSTSLGRPSGEAQPVAATSNRVFVSNGQHLVGLERSTGQVLWDLYLEAAASSATAATEDLVMVGLNTGKLVVYFHKPQAQQFTRQQGPPGGFAFALTTTGPITAPPIPANQVVAFASRGGQVYVAQIEPPLLVHRSQHYGGFSAALGTFGTRTLLAPSLDNNLYAIDLFNGDVLWVFSTGAGVDQQPFVAGDVAYVLNTRGELSALDPKNGDPLWAEASRPTGAATLLAASPKRLYMNSPYGELIVVDRVAGDLVADARASFERAGVDLRDYRVSMTNSQNDRIYLATPSGYLVCLHEIGADRPTPIRDPKALKFGEVPPPPMPAGSAKPPAGSEPPPPETSEPPPPETEVPPPAGGEAAAENPM